MDILLADKHLKRIHDLILAGIKAIGLNVEVERVDDVQDGIPGFAFGSFFIFPTIGERQIGDGIKTHTWVIQRVVNVPSYNREIPPDVDVVDVATIESDVEAVKRLIMEYVGAELDDLLPFVGV